MSRSCTVCRHDAKEEINRALLDSEPFRHIAARTGTSTTALQRHKADHLPVALAQAVEAKAVAHGGSLLEQLKALQGQASSILVKAEAAGDLRAALAGVKEIRGTLELIAKLTGELVNRHEVNVNFFTIEHHIRGIYAELPVEVLERRADRLNQLLAGHEVAKDTVMSAEELWGLNGKGRVVDGTVIETGG